MLDDNSSSHKTLQLYLDMWITFFCTSIYPAHMNYILSGADVNQIHLLKTIAVQSNSHEV